MNFLIIQGGRKALGPLGSGGAQPGSALRARPHHPLPGPLRTALRGRAHRRASSGLCGWRRSDCPRLWNSAKRDRRGVFQSVRCPWNLAGASKGLAAPAITLLSATVPHAAVSQASALQTSRRRARSAEEAALGRVGASAGRAAGRGASQHYPRKQVIPLFSLKVAINIISLFERDGACGFHATSPTGQVLPLAEVKVVSPAGPQSKREPQCCPPASRRAECRRGFNYSARQLRKSPRNKGLARRLSDA
ncbi:uncharacterized protein LOC131905986 [Peromyscus eremicus]|uniref:uncharacterized protein LOC131905986 n=1 Tax=Peromyscus eremicus TaxID=42410 RepID=UPI0027DD42E5|nr:uncharacterized protein LOC131905986 [Peromyscus eremicus]